MTDHSVSIQTGIEFTLLHHIDLNLIHLLFFLHRLRSGFAMIEDQQYCPPDYVLAACTVLWIGNMPAGMSESEARQVFSQFGELQYVKVCF
jgi:hypothetical protein